MGKEADLLPKLIITHATCSNHRKGQRAVLCWEHSSKKAHEVMLSPLKSSGTTPLPEACYYKMLFHKPLSSGSSRSLGPTQMASHKQGIQMRRIQGENKP